MPEMLERFQGERRRFLASLFRQAKKAKVWFDLDLESAGRALGAPRERMVSALDYLAEQELLELRVGGIRHRYRWLRRPDDLEAVSANFSVVGDATDPLNAVFVDGSSGSVRSWSCRKASLHAHSRPMRQFRSGLPTQSIRCSRR